MNQNKTSVVDIHKKNGKRSEFDIYIGRFVRNSEFTRRSKWANPYKKEAFRFGLDCLGLYEQHIKTMMEEYPEDYNLEELRGKRLGCWCITTDKIEPLVCHGQVLMKLLQEKDH